ncbi:MAG: hypothetical protein ACKPKO_40270, partial [Candidatus Fonsibacter sp.]
VLQTIELASGSGEDPNRMAAAELSATPEEQHEMQVEQAKLAFKRTSKKRPMTTEEELRHKQALQGIVETTPSPKTRPPQSPGLQYIQVSEAIKRTYKKSDQSYLLKMDIDVLYRIAKARGIDIIDKSKSTDKKVK